MNDLDAATAAQLAALDLLVERLDWDGDPATAERDAPEDPLAVIAGLVSVCWHLGMSLYDSDVAAYRAMLLDMSMWVRLRAEVENR